MKATTHTPMPHTTLPTSSTPHFPLGAWAMVAIPTALKTAEMNVDPLLPYLSARNSDANAPTMQPARHAETMRVLRWEWTEGRACDQIHGAQSTHAYSGGYFRRCAGTRFAAPLSVSLILTIQHAKPNPAHRSPGQQTDQSWAHRQMSYQTVSDMCGKSFSSSSFAGFTTAVLYPNSTPLRHATPTTAYSRPDGSGCCGGSMMARTGAARDKDSLLTTIDLAFP